MRLADLKPQFVRWEDQPYTGDFVAAGYDTDSDEGTAAWVAAGMPAERRTEMRERQIEVATLGEAQGIRLMCPVCRNHGLAVAFAGRGALDHHGSHDRNGKPRPMAGEWHRLPRPHAEPVRRPHGTGAS